MIQSTDITIAFSTKLQLSYYIALLSEAAMTKYYIKYYWRTSFVLLLRKKSPDTHALTRSVLVPSCIILLYYVASFLGMGQRPRGLMVRW